MKETEKVENMTEDGILGSGELKIPPSMNHNHDNSASDELVSSVSLYRRRPRLFHGTVLPFMTVLYPSWLYVWLGIYGAADYPEAGLLALAAIGIAHILTVLSGYWSVHAHCLLTCVKVKLNFFVFQTDFVSTTMALGHCTVLGWKLSCNVRSPCLASMLLL